MRYVVNMLHMLSYGQQGGWGGGREKHVLCGAARFSQKITLRCAKKKTYTIKGYALYCPFTWPAPSIWPSPPTPTDGSCSWHVLSSCIFSPYTHRSNNHLPYEIPSCIHSLHSYVHPYISCSSLSLCHRSFLPVFLCIGSHITGRIVFPISNFLLTHHFLQFWVSNNFMLQLGRDREEWDLFDRCACA